MDLDELLVQLESVNAQEPPKRWEGTFREYLKLFETRKYPNMGILSHARIYRMILASGIEKVDHFGNERMKYKFFEESLFGIEDTIDKIMSYFHGADKRTETAKRMLLLFGPPSSGKSMLAHLLKRGLEKYTKTEEGAVFALKGSKMHENPFLLIPRELRCEFEEKYGLYIEGELSPMSKYTLLTQYNGRFLEYPIEQIFLSEAERIGVGTWLPSDSKCLSSDCLVWTNKGICRGENIFNNPDVMPEYAVGMNGFVSIKKCYNNGIQPVYKVNASGLIIKATKNHRFLTVTTDGRFEHTYVRDIVGKSVVVKIKSEVFGEDCELQILPDHMYSNRHDDVHIPNKLTPDLSRLVGYLISEGNGDDSQIGFSNQDGAVNRDFQRILANEFLIESNIYYKFVDKKRGDCLVREKVNRGLCICKKKFVDYINLNFSICSLACGKRVPECILKSSKKSQIEFLEGLFIGDGTIRVRCRTASVHYGSCSYLLIRDLQSMLINLGVLGQISYSIDKVYPKNKQYTLSIEGKDAFYLSSILPKFSKHRKIDFSRATKHHKHNYESFGDLRGLIYDIRNSTKGTRGIIDRRYTIRTTNRRSPTRQSLTRWKEHLESTECCWKILQNKSDILNRIDNLLKYRCIPVLSCEYAGQEQVYDLEVDDKDHVFVVNGIVSHNSQDLSELIGGLDLARIQDVGDESDPRSYNFDGELFAANRGMMEFIEGLKCVHGDTRIPTSFGLVKISDLHGEDKNPEIAHELFCSTSTGFREGSITRTCYKGVEKSIKIISHKGFSLSGSIYHRVRVLTNEGTLQWEEIGKLKCGDKIVMSSSCIWPTKLPLLPNCNKISQKIKSEYKGKYDPGNIKKPRIKYITNEVARLLGYFIAEGSYTGHGEKKYGICISNIEPEVISDIDIISKKLGLTSQFYASARSSFINSVVLCRLMDDLGMGNIHHASQKFVPEIIFRSPKRIVKNFLSAYFDGDGTITDKDIACTSASERLISEIQLLLLNFSIISSKRRVWNKDYEKFYHYIEISSDNYDKFVEEIGFNLLSKRQISELRKKRRINHRDSLPFISLFKSIHSGLKAISLKTGCNICPKYQSSIVKDQLVQRDVYEAVLGFANGNRAPSRRSCIKVANAISNIQELQPLSKQLSEICSSPIFIDEVSAVERLGLLDVFDLYETVEHSYISNGFVSHNSDEKFLRVLLTATEEKSVKAPRFGLIYTDSCVIIHTNETEFNSFMKEKKYEAYHDRMIPIAAPYNLGVDNEVKIYEQLLSKSDAMKDMHIAPHTLTAASMFAILSRLESPPDNAELTLIKKMKLYNKQHVKGHKLEQVPDLRRKSPREGMSGVSPRFIIDQIVGSISKARNESRDFITALDILKSLNRGVETRDVFTPEQKTSYKVLLDMARKEWNTMLQNDIQKAFFLSFEEEARNLCNNYLDHIEASSSGQKPKDPITGEEIDIDESLMESIEDQIHISSSGREDFRNEVLRAVGMAARHGKSFDYTQHAALKEAIQKQLFQERQNVIRMTTTTRNPDQEELKRINEVVNRMVEKQGYSVGSANELLKYATAHLFEK